MARRATVGPSRGIVSARRAPDLSSARVRVSEMVRTAMLTGRKGSLSSIRAIQRDRGTGSVQGFVARPVSARKLFQRRCRLPQAMAVDPQVGQPTLDEEARLLRGQRLAEQQRIAFGLDGAPPFAEVAGAAVVGDRKSTRLNSSH